MSTKTLDAELLRAQRDGKTELALAKYASSRLSALGYGVYRAVCTDIVRAVVLFLLYNCQSGWVEIKTARTGIHSQPPTRKYSTTGKPVPVLTILPSSAYVLRTCAPS